MIKNNYMIILEYDGSLYDGWQKQNSTSRTIQGILEAALSKVLGAAVSVIGSGRTDAGVHALGQTVNFYSEVNIRMEGLVTALHENLPEDIRISTVQKAANDFHSRYSAKSKKYLYRLDTGDKQQVFTRKYTYHYPEQLNMESMQAAAGYLTGEHDFRSFCTGHNPDRSAVRTIYSIAFAREGQEQQIEFHGNGFLYNMVRIMTGTLLEVGVGKIKPENIPDILNQRKREAAGFTAPSQGLCLKEVLY